MLVTVGYVSDDIGRRSPGCHCTKSLHSLDTGKTTPYPMQQPKRAALGRPFLQR